MTVTLNSLIIYKQQFLDSEWLTTNHFSKKNQQSMTEIVACVLLTSNHVILLVQFDINEHSYTLKTTSAYHLNGIFGNSGVNSNGTVHPGRKFSEKR